MRRYLQVYMLLLIAIGLTVSGEILLKLGMNLVSAEVGAFSLNLPVLLRTFTEWRIILGFALIFGGSLFWLGVISRADFSFAYPLLALSYVVALLPARFILLRADLAQSCARRPGCGRRRAGDRLGAGCA